MDALGLLGAAIFDCIADWYQPNAKTGKAKLKVQDCHGGYWVACSYADLKEQTGLKKRDAERGIADCVEAGVIETTVMKFGKGADRKPMLHIRISAANGQPILKGPLIVSPPAEKGPKHAGVLKNDSQAPMCASLGDQSTPGCFPNTSPTFASPTSSTTQDSVAASPATKATTANSSMPTGKTSQKPNQPPDAVVVPKIDKTLLKNGKRPLTIARVWEAAQKEFHPTYAVALTRDDCKVLRDARSKMYEAGVSPDLMVRFAVEHWFSALFGINGGSGLKFTPKTFSSYLGNFLAHFKANYVSPEQAAEEKAKHDAYVAKWDAEIAAEKAAKALAAASAPKVSKWLQPKADEANKQATTKSANPPAVPYPCAVTPAASKPATEAVSAPACPLVVQVDQVIAAPVSAKDDLPMFDDERLPEPSFETCQAWWKAATAAKRARDAEAAKKAASVKLTASASYHYKPHATA